MPQVVIIIGESTKRQCTYDLSCEIEISLKQVKQIRNGDLPKKSVKETINGK